MLYFANPSTPDVCAAMSRRELGCIITPKQRLPVPTGAIWCADNGCFGKGYPGDAAWWAWLHQLPWPVTDCAFAVAPDVVGDAAATIARSRPWLQRIRRLGMPAAFVAQDGLDELPVPWSEFDVLFIGGSDAFKLGAAARELTAEAVSQGIPVHMGRVNSRKRLAYAHLIGCQTADGTYIRFGPDVNLPKAQGWARAVNDQGVLPVDDAPVVLKGQTVIDEFLQ